MQKYGLIKAEELWRFFFIMQNLVWRSELLFIDNWLSIIPSLDKNGCLFVFRDKNRLKKKPLKDWNFGVVKQFIHPDIAMK